MDYGKETIRALAGDDFGRLHWVEYRQAQHGKPTGLYLAHDKAGAVPLDNPLRGRHPTGDLEAPVLPIPFNVAEFIAFEDMAGPLGLVEQLSDEERQALRKSAPAAHALVVAVLKGPPAQHGAGPTHWTIENAAAAIAVQEGWHNEARDTLCEQMMQAARDGVLTVRHPHTGLPYRPDPVRKFYETVTPADANAWLAFDPVQTLLRHGPAPVTAEPVARDASAPADEFDFPLAQSLAPWFNCRLDQVPDKWRAKLEQAAFPHWDDMNAAGRLSWAEQFDAQSDPAREHERNAAWQYVVRRNDLLSEQAKLEAMQPDKPSELAIRRQELARIALELSDLESRSTAEPAATVGAPAPAEADDARDAAVQMAAVAALSLAVEPAGDKSLTRDAMAKRAALLARFREFGGKRPCEGGKKGKHGALAALERETKIDDKNLGQMLDKAIEDKRGADAFAQLAQKR